MCFCSYSWFILFIPDACEDKLQNDLENILFSLSYMTRMCDLTKWDFAKLRDVFLTWNKGKVE